MNEPAATPIHEDDSSNVERLPTPPRLRVVKALEEAEKNVVDVSARVAAAIEENARPKRVRKKASPKAKKPDPILSTANVTNSQNPSVEGVAAVDEGAAVEQPTAALLLQNAVDDGGQYQGPPPAYLAPRHVTSRGYAIVAAAIFVSTALLTYVLLTMR